MLRTTDGRIDTDQPNALSQIDFRIELRHHDSVQCEDLSGGTSRLSRGVPRESSRIDLHEGDESPQSHPECELNSLACFFDLDVEQSRALIICPQGDAPPGLVERDNTRLNHGRKHETPEGQPDSGTGDSNQKHVEIPSDDSEMNFEECLDGWKDSAGLRMKESSIHEYTTRFKRFDKIVNLRQYTRRQFKAHLHDILVKFYTQTPKGSWRYENSKLADFFRDGLLMEWPEKEVSRIQRRLPRINQGYAPPMKAVKPWIDAVLSEPDTYRRLLVMSIMEFGWRPDHLYKLWNADLKYDENGEPSSIEADGEERDFKYPDDVGCNLPPVYQKCLREYLKVRGEVKPSDRLFCYRDAKGQLDPRRQLDDKCLAREWEDFIEVHNRLLPSEKKLPRLLRTDFRHWVCAAHEQELGSDKLAYSTSAYITGHSQTQMKADPSYRTYYSRQMVEESLEFQRQKIPEGLICRFASVKANLDAVEECPWLGEWVTLGRRFFGKEIGEIDLATEAGRVRLKCAEGGQSFDV